MPGPFGAYLSKSHAIPRRMNNKQVLFKKAEVESSGISKNFLLPTQRVKFLSSGSVAPFDELALAEMGALAIENARMYEQLRKDYENLMTDISMFVENRRSI